MKVAIYDTSIGGMYIFKELVRKFPNNDYIYYLDKDSSPLSKKRESEIISIFNNKIKPELDKGEFDLIFISINVLSIVMENNNLSFDTKYILITDLHKDAAKDHKDATVLTTGFSAKTGYFQDIYSEVVYDQPLKIKIERKSEVHDFEIDVYNKKTIVAGCTEFMTIGKRFNNYINILDYFKIEQENKKGKESIREFLNGQVIETCSI